MKKLSVLIALALCLTIGGAYATWTYYTTVPGAKTGDVSIALEASETVEAGTLDVVVSSDAKLTIDDVNSNYVPGFVSVGTITVTFTPNGKDSEIKTNGIELPLAISSNKSVITVDDEADGLVIGKANSSETFRWTSNGNGGFTCVISVSDIAGYLTINGGNALDTIDKYNSFKTSLGSDAKITVTVGNDTASN